MGCLDTRYGPNWILETRLWINRQLPCSLKIKVNRSTQRTFPICCGSTVCWLVLVEVHILQSRISFLERSSPGLDCQPLRERVLSLGLSKILGRVITSQKHCKKTLHNLDGRLLSGSVWKTTTMTMRFCVCTIVSVHSTVIPTHISFIVKWHN